MKPFYADDSVTLWHGDCREIVPTLDVQPDCVVADPPYAETSLAWDRWPDGWPAVLAAAEVRSMWCFGSMRMFLDRRDEFAAWRLSQDVVWEKGAGAGLQNDRFRRVHEAVAHWYRGTWGDVWKDAQREPVPPQDRRDHTFTYGGKPEQCGTKSSRPAVHWRDDGTRLVRSVIHTKSMRGRALHPTEKHPDLLGPLLRYACPPGGLVLDPFAGSGSTAVAARLAGRRAVLVEADERYCEVIARRLAQGVLPIAEEA